jgi:hypothetical protein
VVALAIGAPMTAAAQAPAGAGTVHLTHPHRNAKDLKAVLFNWMWGMGMLKGTDERDMVASLEYQAKTGTIQVDGQPCALTTFRASTNYQTYSQRIQYSARDRTDKSCRTSRSSAGSTPGTKTSSERRSVEPKGKPLRWPATVQERLIRIWASPQGAAKAALAGTTETWWLGANPGTLFADGVAKVRDTSVSWDTGKPVVTFPIPGVPGATGTATLDAKYMTERVVVTQGSNTTEFTYSNYQDWNNPLNKIEVFYAGKMVERKNGAVVRDLTTDVTETGNVYVVAPVPPSVQAAIKPTGQLPRGVFNKQEVAVDKTTPTPRLGAHPDLSGSWQHTDWIGNYMGNGGRPMRPDAEKPCNRTTNQTEDFELYAPSRFGQLSRPLYKPEHWDKVQELDMWTNKYDPGHDLPASGVPREGPPRRIYQTDNDVTFIYTGGDAGGGYGEFRIIPTDNRKRNADAQYDITYLGNSVGRWEGDTLVIDSIGFIDTTWLARGGFFPHRSDACRREIHASGRYAPVRRHG